MSTSEPDSMPITEARADLSEVISSTRHLRRCVLLTRRGTPHAALIPPDVGEAINMAGGVDAVLAILRERQP